ncbi:unnamed protein product [Coccothraustes coccothraustes]
MQALRKAEDANVELSGAKRRARAAFGSSRALESSGTGTMLSARRSRFFASGSRRARPLLRPQERRSTTVAFSAQPSKLIKDERVEKLSAKIQALRKAEDANVELSGAKCRARAAFGSSRALESSGTATMLSARRSRFFASGSRRARPLLRPEERSSTTVAFSAQPQTHQGRVEKLSAKMQALRKAEDANVELSGAKCRARAAFGSSRALASSGTATMLSARRSRFFASGSRRARPLLRPEERSSTTVAFSAQPSNSSRTVPFLSTTF